MSTMPAAQHPVYDKLAENTRTVPVARDIIVLGTSAGGLAALKKLLQPLPRDLPAAIFITMHLFGRTDSVLSDILDEATSLPVRHPEQDDLIEQGQVYIAPPDRHLLLTPDGIHLSRGPKENMQRPSINAMFRSAAAVYGERVAGVVLTGLLDDGAAGLWEIQRRGGLTLVQDPQEAEYDSMPRNAVEGIDVDYVLPLAELSPTLARLAQGFEKGQRRVATEIPNSTGPTLQTCPECGGAMTQSHLGPLREYRCHIGHRLGLKTMIAEKRELHERMLLAAIAQAEELVALLEERKKEENPASEIECRREIEQHRNRASGLRKLLDMPASG